MRVAAITNALDGSHTIFGQAGRPIHFALRLTKPTPTYYGKYDFSHLDSLPPGKIARHARLSTDKRKDCLADARRSARYHVLVPEVAQHIAPTYGLCEHNQAATRFNPDQCCTSHPTGSAFGKIQGGGMGNSHRSSRALGAQSYVRSVIGVARIAAMVGSDARVVTFSQLMVHLLSLRCGSGAAQNSTSMDLGLTSQCSRFTF